MHDQRVAQQFRCCRRCSGICGFFVIQAVIVLQILLCCLSSLIVNYAGSNQTQLFPTKVERFTCGYFGLVMS